MLKIEMLNLGIYWVNAYIIREENSSTCCILDPGGHPKKVLDYLAKNNLTLEAILLTHGHFDHVGAVKELHAATGCKVYMNPDDLVMPEKLTAGPELGNRLYEQFLADCAALGYPPQHGRFGADMKVESVNDGPVTLILDTDQLMNEPRRK